MVFRFVAFLQTAVPFQFISVSQKYPGYSVSFHSGSVCFLEYKGLSFSLRSVSFQSFPIVSFHFDVIFLGFRYVWFRSVS